MKKPKSYVTPKNFLYPTFQNPNEGPAWNTVTFVEEQWARMQLFFFFYTI